MGASSHLLNMKHSIICFESGPLPSQMTAIQAPAGSSSASNPTTGRYPFGLVLAHRQHSFPANVNLYHTVIAPDWQIVFAVYFFSRLVSLHTCIYNVRIAVSIKFLEPAGACEKLKSFWFDYLRL
jgi:hypothetical protein